MVHGVIQDDTPSPVCTMTAGAMQLEGQPTDKTQKQPTHQMHSRVSQGF